MLMSLTLLSYQKPTHMTCGGYMEVIVIDSVNQKRKKNSIHSKIIIPRYNQNKVRYRIRMIHIIISGNCYQRQKKRYC